MIEKYSDIDSIASQREREREREKEKWNRTNIDAGVTGTVVFGPVDEQHVHAGVRACRNERALSLSHDNTRPRTRERARV